MHFGTAACVRAAQRTALVLFLPLAGLAACDTGTSTNDGEDPVIEGTWTATSNGLTYYAVITANSADLYEGLDGVCFNTLSLEIVSRDGDQVTVREAGGSATVTVTVTRQGEQLKAQGLFSGLSLIMDSSSQDLAGVTACQIVGDWAFTENGLSSHVTITEDSFTAWDGAATGCRDEYAFTLESAGGHDYTLTDNTGAELPLSIVNRAGTLVVTFPAGNSNRYTESTEDPSTFDVCGGGDDDPAGMPCSELPQLQFGTPVQGELTTDDLFAVADTTTNEGWYYDLYGLTLETRQPVQIDESSDPVDTLLRLWTDAGELVTFNDDNADSFNSTIAITLDAGCYRVEASSYGFSDTGVYTLSVN